MTEYGKIVSWGHNESLARRAQKGHRRTTNRRIQVYYYGGDAVGGDSNLVVSSEASEALFSTTTSARRGVHKFIICPEGRGVVCLQGTRVESDRVSSHFSELDIYFGMMRKTNDVSGNSKTANTCTGERKKSLQILLSYSQAGPGRKTKQGQEEISRNHVPTFFLGSV